MELYLDAKDLKSKKFYRLPSSVISGFSGTEYVVDEWFARGGFSAVYRGSYSVGGNEVAIKFLLSEDEVLSRRFENEIEINRRVKHEHIIQMLDHGIVIAEDVSFVKKEIPFVVLELADCNLSQFLKKRNLESKEYFPQFLGLAEALGVIHKHAIHRDIKPENVLVKGEVWKLSDFGLCALDDHDSDLTGFRESVGPKYWFSPEAHNKRLGNGDEIMKSSDVFQLAALFWYIATKRHPSGLLRSEDWNGESSLGSVLRISLMHNESLRPKNGEVFFKKLKDTWMS